MVRKKTGRPKKYDPAYAKQAREACKFGASDAQLAKLFGVGASTISGWKLKYPKFAKAIQEGRAALEAGEVELSLRQQALPHDEVKNIHELRGRGRNKKMMLVSRHVKKNVVNIRAIERVLKAEMPEKYGDKLKLDVPKPLQIVHFNKKKQ